MAGHAVSLRKEGPLLKLLSACRRPATFPCRAMGATLQQTVERWQQNAGGAGTKWDENIQSSQADQAGLAIAAKGAMVANFNQAVQSGLWERRIQESGGTQNWKAKSHAKMANYGTGIAAGAPKFQAAMQTWLPIIQSTAQAVRAMPSGTIDLSIARMTQYARALHQARLSR